MRYGPRQTARGPSLGANVDASPDTGLLRTDALGRCILFRQESLGLAIAFACLLPSLRGGLLGLLQRGPGRTRLCGRRCGCGGGRGLCARRARGRRPCFNCGRDVRGALDVHAHVDGWPRKHLSGDAASEGQAGCRRDCAARRSRQPHAAISKAADLVSQTSKGRPDGSDLDRAQWRDRSSRAIVAEPATHQVRPRPRAAHAAAGVFSKGASKR